MSLFGLNTFWTIFINIISAVILIIYIVFKNVHKKKLAEAKKQTDQADKTE